MMLNNHSTYSLGYGAVKPKDWVEWAQEQGLGRLALTDINSTAMGIEWVRLCQDNGLSPVLGADIRNGVQQQYVLLARSNEGFSAINRFLSFHLQRGEPFGDLQPEFPEVYVVYPFGKEPARPLSEHEFVGVRPQQLNRLRLSPWRRQPAKLVALHTQSFRHKADHNAHRLLRSIHDNTLLSKLQPGEQAPASDLLLPPEVWQQVYADFPELLTNAQSLLDSCQVQFELKNYQRSENRKVWTEGGTMDEDRQKILQLCREGLHYRYGNSPSGEVRQRLHDELEVLELRGFYSYFLINWDIIRYATHKGYYHVGRGSGANSLVAYLLGITDVDPIALNLYFERFMNLSRQQPPDFDVDFSWRDRQDVTRYIFERYPKSALLGAHSTFQYRATVRELGKVLGLPAADIEQLSHPRTMSKDLDKVQRAVLKYGKYIEGFPHQHTIHSSGILIPERGIDNFGATFLPPKGFPTVQFDMYSAEDAGLYKFDILGQRGLGKIKDALTLVKKNHPQAEEIDIHDPRPFSEHERVKEMLRQGQTTGCFYVESPAMRGLLKKLGGDTYESLVAASSIIRPGVSKSGMMHEYIRRFRNPEARQGIHPKLGEILADTYGVMVYQEDVLRVASQFAGLSLEESDILRRGMSWKFKERNRFQEVKDKFFDNCAEYGYPQETTQTVWTQIETFANFAFAKGHSASYAVESYQSLFLKAEYPLEYMVATINNGGGFYSRETYVNEARLLGGQIEPPCINHSEQECTLEGKRIYLGLGMIQGLEDGTMARLLSERTENGSYVSMGDLLDRLEITLEQLVLLIRIGAFRSLHTDKQQLLWQAHFHFGKAKRNAPLPDLFRSPPKEYSLPSFEQHSYEEALEQIELLGFSLGSPFELLAEPMGPHIMAADMASHLGEEVRLYGYLIHVKNLNTRGKTSQHMAFGCFLDEAGHFIDSVHFPQSVKRYPFQGKGIYRLQGKVVEDYDFISLEVKEMSRLPYRDFEAQEHPKGIPVKVYSPSSMRKPKLEG